MRTYVKNLIRNIFRYCQSCYLLVFTLSQLVVMTDAAVITPSNTAPDGIYIVGKPLILTWKIEYFPDDTIKTTSLLLYAKDNSTNQKIATNSEGFMDIGKKLLKDKATVTITAYSIEVDFPVLSYGDEYIFTCQVYSGDPVKKLKQINDTISVNNVKGGIIPCGDYVEENEYFLEEGSQSFALTLCGHPQPKLHYRIGGQEYTANGTQVVDEEQAKYKYEVTLNNVTSTQCGQRIYFQAEGFKSWQSNATITVKYTPARVERFKFLKEIGEKENCTTLEWNGQSAVLCNLTYIVHLFDDQMRRLETFNTSGLQYERCDNQTFDNVTFANIQANWLDDTGPGLDKAIKFELTSNNTIDREMHVPIYNEEKSGFEGLSFVIPVILALLIVVLLLVIFIVYHIKKRNGTLTVIAVEKGYSKNEKRYKCEHHRKSGSYDLV